MESLTIRVKYGKWRKMRNKKANEKKLMSWTSHGCPQTKRKLQWYMQMLVIRQTLIYPYVQGLCSEMPIPH